MIAPRRVRILRPLGFGILAALLGVTALSEWWTQPEEADARRAPPPGKRLVNQKKVVQRWADNDDFGDLWIYGDLEQGFEEARHTGKPILVTYRCVP